MFTLGNLAVRRCCYDQPKIVDKAANLYPWAKPADLILGVALLIIGTLVIKGVIPIGGAEWFFTFGAAQIGFVIIKSCFNCCSKVIQWVKNQGGICSLIGQMRASTGNLQEVD